MRLDFPVDVDFVERHPHRRPGGRAGGISGVKHSPGLFRVLHGDVDNDTRKMTTEIEVPTPKLEIDLGYVCNGFVESGKTIPMRWLFPRGSS